MEPRIQYAKASDGVNIAFATAGDGPPLLLVPNGPQSHVQAIWEMWAHILQPLAERFHLVWYDFRGSGLSDREATDFSMDAMVRDLEAVVETAGSTRLAMSALVDAVPIAVTYAAIRPEKISSLVLVDGWMKSSDWKQTPAWVAEEALRSGDWAVYTETLARVLSGLENQEFAARYAAYIRDVSNRKLCVPRFRIWRLGMSPLFCRGCPPIRSSSTTATTASCQCNLGNVWPPVSRTHDSSW